VCINTYFWCDILQEAAWRVIGCSLKWLLRVSWLLYMFPKPYMFLQLMGRILSVWNASQPIYKEFYTGRLHAKVAWSFHSQTCCNMNENTRDVFVYVCLLNASWHHNWFSCYFQKYNRNSGHRFWVRLLKFGTDYNVCTYTHVRELMKSVGEEW